jgi:pyocin large subunit-like protein
MSRRFLLVLACALGLAALSGAPRLLHRAPAPAVPRSAVAPAPSRPDVGFRSPAHLAEHYRKHGVDFGRVTMEEYLRLAQSLRDRPAGGRVLEAVRDDGVVTRFDRATGAFIAFDEDGTIRTFFKPHEGEAYFRRQLARAHEGP